MIGDCPAVGVMVPQPSLDGVEVFPRLDTTYPSVPLACVGVRCAFSRITQLLFGRMMKPHSGNTVTVVSGETTSGSPKNLASLDSGGLSVQ
jgi:hypothetical protein